ncbi:MAG: hypothetical protein CMF45_08335 [Legionellales bacterium]|nr:hypothetical protein [Legionellales bacterium]
MIQVSLKKIQELNDVIGLGEYGLVSSIRYQVALEYLSDICKKDKSICEIGPGGVIAYVARYSDADTSAIVNPLETHWDHHFKSYGINLYQWDLNEPLNNRELHGLFDCVIFLETLEHLNRWPEKVLADIHKLLKPQGTLLLSTPNLVRASNRLRMLLGRPPNNPFKYTSGGEHHVREYTLGELKDFMPEKDWKIIEYSYEFPHSLRSLWFFKIILKFFKAIVGTIIFIKAKKNIQ